MRWRTGEVHPSRAEFGHKTECAGICFVFGFPSFDSSSPSQRLLSLLMNIAMMIIASALTYAALRVKGASRRFFDRARYSAR